MIYIKAIFLGLLFVSCGSLKQPTQEQTIALLTQVLNDLAESKEFVNTDPFRFVEREFTKSIYGHPIPFDDNHFFKTNTIFFSNLKHCKTNIEKLFNINKNEPYYREQRKINNSSLIKVKNNKIRNKDESRLQNYLEISRPFFSPKKDWAIILIASSKLGGGELKAYQLINNIWTEECSFFAFMH